MGRIEDKRSIIVKINEAASLYKQHLVGRRFMYVFDGRYVEVLYKKSSFRHLTGVESTFGAEQFFNLAAKGKLRAEQVVFPPDKFDLCLKKSQFVCHIAALARSESFMLERIGTSTASFAIGATDLNFALLMNRHGNDECYSADSLRKGDCFSICENVYAITHIFSKRNDEKLYTDLHYCESAEAAVPAPVRELLAPGLADAIAYSSKVSDGV